MKNLVILGTGTAGTIMANKLRPLLDTDTWRITLIDQNKTHYYQPGFLFIPFGIYTEKDVVKPKQPFFPSGIESVFSEVDRIVPEKSQIIFKDGNQIPYDVLIIATGSRINPAETEGLQEGGWHKNIFDFYTLKGALALREFLSQWTGGKLVLSIMEMPIKCPVAPLEFVFLADWWFAEQGIRQDVEIEFVTPLPGAFTKPKASQVFGDFLEQKNIRLHPEFNTEKVDWQNNKLHSWDERVVDYDLLVVIPTNMGAEVIERSNMGDELHFIPTDRHTLQSKEYKNIFVIGDATDLPSSKAGSVAHFQAEILQENIMNYIAGRPLKAQFDGHANCYIETGFHKGIMIDFNYDTEPLPGKFPLPGVGPFSLLEETKMNHYGKMLFRWMYWNLLLKGTELPIEASLSLAGKRI
jgi:sulfide:quinone oxidoreductase